MAAAPGRPAAGLARRRRLRPRAEDDRRAIPPLVFAGEARSLQASLAEVAAGNAFLLQAGDCAECFEDFSADNIREKLRVILQMAVVLTYSLGVPGREGRAHRRPVRQAPLERRPSAVGDVDLPSFRGHIVNGSPSDAGGPHARPRAARAGVPPVGVDAEPAAGVHQGRLRRPHPGPRVDPGVRRVEPGGPALRAAGRRDRPGPALHAGLRRRHRVQPEPRARSTSTPATRR